MNEFDLVWAKNIARVIGSGGAVSILLNSFILLLLIRNRKENNVNLVLLGMLALLEIVATIFGPLFLILSSKDIFPDNYCMLRFPIILTSTIASYQVITFIALDRYFKIVKKTTIPIKVVFGVLFSAFAVDLIIYLSCVQPNFFVFSKRYFVCVVNSDFKTSQHVYMALNFIINIFCIIVTTTTYMLLWYHVRKNFGAVRTCEEFYGSSEMSKVTLARRASFSDMYQREKIIDRRIMQVALYTFIISVVLMLPVNLVSANLLFGVQSNPVLVKVALSMWSLQALSDPTFFLLCDPRLRKYAKELFT